MSKVKVMDHPLIQHKIGVIRRKDTCSKDFRTIISEIAMLMCYEATRELKLTDVEIETPILSLIHIYRMGLPDIPWSRSTDFTMIRRHSLTVGQGAFTDLATIRCICRFFLSELSKIKSILHRQTEKQKNKNDFPNGKTIAESRFCFLPFV